MTILKRHCAFINQTGSLESRKGHLWWFSFPENPRVPTFEGRGGSQGSFSPITTSHCHPLWMDKSSKHKLQKSWITLQANYPDCCPVYDCEEGTEVVLLFFFTQKIWQTKVTCGQCTLIFNNILHKKIFQTKTSENIFMLVKLTSFLFQVVYVTPPSTKKAAKKEGEWGRGGWLRDEKK